MPEQIVVSRRLGRGVLPAAALASTSLVVSIVTSAHLLSRAYVQRGEQPEVNARTLEVTGSAKMRVSSDLAIWDIHVAGEGETVPQAYSELASTTDAVRGFLDARGFPQDSITLGAIDTTARHKHVKRRHGGDETEEDVFVSYELSRGFEVRTSDVARVEKAAGEVTELLKIGAHVESGAPRFVYTRIDELKVQMIGAATANARERADTIASSSKCRVGAVKVARAGVLQITPPWSTEVSDEGVNDATSVEKDVTAVVHLTLTIEPASS